MLASGDTSVDIFTLSEDMSRSFSAAGFLYDLTDEVMTDEVAAEIRWMPALARARSMAAVYIVPNFLEYITFFADEAVLKEYGFEKIATLEEFEAFCEGCEGCQQRQVRLRQRLGSSSTCTTTWLFGTYAFGGDLHNWKDENTMKALEFMKKMLDNGWTTAGSMADQYDTFHAQAVRWYLCRDHHLLHLHLHL